MKPYTALIAFLLLFSCGSPEADKTTYLSNPTLKVTWKGYKDGNIIKLVKIDTLIPSELKLYAQTEHTITETVQNVHYFFYTNQPPDNIPVPERQAPNFDNPKQSSLFLAHEFVRQTKPVATVLTIYLSGHEPTVEYFDGFTY